MYQKALNALDYPLKDTDFGKISWNRIIDAAEKHKAPGSFTALIGFEWTPAPNGSNLHSCVLFRDGKDRASQAMAN